MKINPKLALALRLASYFHHYPLAHSTIQLGVATLAVDLIINNLSPASWDDYTPEERATLAPKDSSGMVYKNFQYCKNCGTEYHDLPTYHYWMIIPVCSACIESPNREDFTAYSTEYNSNFYTPIHIRCSEY